LLERRWRSRWRLGIAIIFVPADEVSPIAFDITAEQREALNQRGNSPANSF
jgi:hypothetical protein